MMFEPTNPENYDAMRAMFGPHQVDQAVRQAITMCWYSLPEGKRTVGNVEAQIRRLMDRALDNMREDAGHFGFKDV